MSPRTTKPTVRKAEALAKLSLSVIIPVFNEAATIAEIVRRVRAVPIPKEIIIVDDGSTDGTPARLRALSGTGVRIVRMPSNGGKGAALREGLKAARNDIVIIQDADLEYDPAEYPELLRPIAQGVADVVYGSRFLTSKSHRVLMFWHSVMNRFLTMCCNMFTNLNLTDIETCYKAFRREVIQKVRLREDRFGFEPEVTIKLARQNVRFYEVGISYYGRSYGEGKKVRARDALRALYCILRYGIFG